MRMNISDPEAETPEILQGMHNFSHLDVSALSRSPPPPASCTGRDLWDWGNNGIQLGARSEEGMGGFPLGRLKEQLAAL